MGKGMRGAVRPRATGLDAAKLEEWQWRSDQGDLRLQAPPRLDVPGAAPRRRVRAVAVCSSDTEIGHFLEDKYMPPKGGRGFDWPRRRRCLDNLVTELAELREAGAELGVHSCRTVLTIAGRCDAVGFAQRFFDDMLGRGVVLDSTAYNALLGAYCRRGLIKPALRIAEAMKREGFPPSTSVYTSLIATHTRLGDTAGGRQIFEKALQLGFENNTVWDAGLGTCETFTEAQKLLGRMAERGVFPSKATFLTLLRICGRTGDVAAAQSVLEVMRQNGVPVEASAETSLLNAHVRARDFCGARRVWEGMHSSSRDGVAATVFLGALVAEMGEAGTRERSALLKEGEEVFQGVQSTGRGGDPSLWTAMMRLYGAHGKSRRRCDLLLDAYRRRRLPPMPALAKAYEEATGTTCHLKASYSFWRIQRQDDAVSPPLPPGWGIG
eukprot:Hpha_TRINITY_DN22865_c0_g1::TRINITY_DN22865_c0_g1_i1::g.84420::m.84420